MSVSVIVPVYKVERYIRECIESVLAQSYEDFELILVDDGSPDHCGAICDEYARKDRRIRVIHKENGGVSNARNAGLDAATGKYIYFLDSDDYAHPSLLEKAVEQMETGLDMVVFNSWSCYDDGTVTPNAHPVRGDISFCTDREKSEFLKKTLLDFKIGWAPWNRVYVREIIEKYELRFADYRRIVAEDLYFCFCYCTHIQKIRVIDDHLYYYRLREESLTVLQKKRMMIGRYNELGKEIYAYLNRFPDCGYFAGEFSSIYFTIMKNPIWAEFAQEALTDPQLRDKVRENIQDWDFFAAHMKQQIARWPRNNTGLSSNAYHEMVCYTKYLLGGSCTALKWRLKLLYACWEMLN